MADVCLIHIMEYLDAVGLIHCFRVNQQWYRLAANPLRFRYFRFDQHAFDCIPETRDSKPVFVAEFMAKYGWHVNVNLVKVKNQINKSRFIDRCELLWKTGQFKQVRQLELFDVTQLDLKLFHCLPLLNALTLRFHSEVIYNLMPLTAPHIQSYYTHHSEMLQPVVANLKRFTTNAPFSAQLLSQMTQLEALGMDSTALLPPFHIGTWTAWCDALHSLASHLVELNLRTLGHAININEQFIWDMLKELPDLRRLQLGTVSLDPTAFNLQRLNQLIPRLSDFACCFIRGDSQLAVFCEFHCLSRLTIQIHEVITPHILKDCIALRQLHIEFISFIAFQLFIQDKLQIFHQLVQLEQLSSVTFSDGYWQDVQFVSNDVIQLLQALLALKKLQLVFALPIDFTAADYITIQQQFSSHLQSMDMKVTSLPNHNIHSLLYPILFNPNPTIEFDQVFIL